MIKMHRFIMIRRRKNDAQPLRGAFERDAELNYRLMKLPGEMKSLSVPATAMSPACRKNIRDEVDDDPARARARNRIGEEEENGYRGWWREWRNN